jgi:hypothetical protein
MVDRGFAAIAMTLLACGRVDFASERDAGAPVLVASASLNMASAAVTVPVQPTGPGNILVIASITQPTASVVSITDDVGSTYVPAGCRGVFGGAATEIWYAAVDEGATSVTLMFDDSWGATVWATEFSGIRTSSPVVAVAKLDDQPGTAIVSGASAPAAADQLVFTVLATTTVQGMHPGNAFVPLDWATGDDSAFYVAPDTGTYAAVWDVDPPGGSCSSTAVFAASP